MYCILCNLSNFELKNLKIRNDKLNIYKIYKCLNCKHIQLYPNNYDIKTYYDNNSQDIESKSIHNREQSEFSEMLINFHLQRIKILEDNIHITKDMKIIDIGGGNCEFAESIIQKYNSSIYVLDPGASRINNNCNKNIIKINALLDNAFADSNKNTFDIVTAFHVLEHLINPIEFLNNCYKLLKPHGLLYIEVPNQDDMRIELSEYYRNNIWYCQAHISYFTYATLKYILDKIQINNYKICTFERYNYENYIYWIKNNKPQPICTYYKGTPSSIEENNWINTRQTTFKSDTLYIIIKKLIET